MSSLEPAPAPHQRFDYIDTLRGLAAAYVVIYHVLYIPQPSLSISPRLIPWISRGYTGVTLFFVLSAFTMMNSMRGRSGESRRDLKFYIRRFFRIAPLYYFWLAVMLLRILAYRIPIPPLWIFTTFTFTFNFFPGWEQGLVWASWTLGVEMFFYLLFPLFFRFVTDWKRAVLLIPLTILIAFLFEQFIRQILPASSVDLYLYTSFFMKLPAFAFGILIFFVYEALIEGRKVPRVWSIFLLAAALAGFPTFVYHWIPFRSVIFELVFTSAFFSCLVLGLAIQPWRVVVNRLTIFLGTISYSVYLAHPVVIQYLIPLFRRIYGLVERDIAAYLLASLISFVIVVFAAFVTYRLIEKPGMQLGSRLTRSVGLKQSAQPALVRKASD